MVMKQKGLGTLSLPHRIFIHLILLLNQKMGIPSISKEKVYGLMKIDINISLSENSTGTHWISDLSSQDLCPELQRVVKLLIETFVEDLEEELSGGSPGNTPTSRSLNPGSQNDAMKYLALEPGKAIMPNNTKRYIL